MPLTERDLLRRLRATHPNYALLKDDVFLLGAASPADIGRAALACWADKGAPPEQHGWAELASGSSRRVIDTPGAGGIGHVPVKMSLAAEWRLREGGDLTGLYLRVAGGEKVILLSSSTLALARNSAGHGAIYPLAGGHPLFFAKGQCWRADSPDLKQPLKHSA
jgi:hypothetical protein